MQQILDVYQRSKSLLAAQFQNTLPDDARTNFQKLLYSILTQTQTLQDQNYLLNTQRSLDTAQGVQLDGLGEILGLARASGQPDDSETIDGVYVQGYRESLQYQVFVNSSSGTPEQVMYSLKFLTHASRVWIFEDFPAAFQLATNGLVFPANPSDLVAAIQNISPAGVKFEAVTAIYNTTPFVFSSDPIYEQLYVNPDPDNINQSNPFQVDPGTGLADFYIQRGETVNPDFGGCFAEAILVAYPVYDIDTTNAGQLAEAIM